MVRATIEHPVFITFGFAIRVRVEACARFTLTFYETVKETGKQSNLYTDLGG